MSDKEVVLNGKKVSEEEFKVLKEEAEKKPGVVIVEKKPGEYKTRIKG
jgi:hypothetical protein